MARYLALHLHCGDEIAVQECYGAAGFGRLAEMLGSGVTTGRHPAPAVELRTADSGRAGYEVYSSGHGGLSIRLTDGGSFEAVVAHGVPERIGPQMRLWHYLVICAGIGAVLRGIPAVLVHGAALMDGESALLLCGDSGIGKSTTAARWEKLGRRVAADDMFLLECGDGGAFHIHSLPTWSRCADAPENTRFPADRALPVAGVLGLSRSRNGDRVAAVSRAEFFARIARSMFFHTSGIVKLLPVRHQRTFGSRLAALAGKVAEAFPPCGFFADLNGDLAAAVTDYRVNFAGTAARVEDL